MGLNSIAYNYSKEWAEIDKLMQKPALTSAENALNKLDKSIKSKGNDKDKLRSVIYRFAIKYGCEYSLFDNKRTHYANNDNEEEGNQILLETFAEARDLMLTMSNKNDKVVALMFMYDVIHKYESNLWRHGNTKIQFDTTELSNNPKDKLGIWADKFQGDELNNYLTVRHLGIKELSELPNDNIKDLEVGIVRELQSYLESGAEDNISDFAYLMKDLGDKQTYTLVSDLVVNVVRGCSNIDEENNIFAPLFWNWNEKWEVVNSKDKLGLNLRLAQNQFITHIKRNEYRAAVSHFIYYGDAIYRNKKDRNIKEYSENYISACEKLMEFIKDDEAAVTLANRTEELMLYEYNTKCLPSEMDSTLPKRILDHCDKYIKAYPHAKNINKIKFNREILLRHSFNATISKSVIASTDSVVLNLKYANVEKFEVELLKCNDITDLKEILNCNNRERIKNSTPVKIKQNIFELEKSNYYIKKFRDIKIAEKLEPGLYYIKVKDAEEKDINKILYIPFTVSDIFTVNMELSNGGEYIYCVDRTTGYPIEGVTVDLIRDGKKVASGKSDSTGKYIAQNENYYNIYTHNGADKYNPTNWRKQYYNYGNRNDNIVINTDRSIYRPGQTVHINLLAYNSDSTHNEIRPDRNLYVKIEDPNYKVVFDKVVRTNAFGTATLDFVIPTGKLNGRYRISTDNGYGATGFSVEEYVRPKFFAKVENYSGVIALDNEITINGVAKLYSGEPLINADVRIKIRKQNSYDWRNPGLTSEPYFEVFDTKSDENGKFSVKFIPRKNKAAADTLWIEQEYIIDGSVTAPSGESQEFNDRLRVCNEDLKIAANIKDKEIYDINEKLNVSVSSTDALGKPKTSEIIVKLLDSHAEEVKELGRYTVTGDTTLSYDLHSIGVGEWEIEISNEILDKYDYEYNENDLDFVVFDKKSNVCPVNWSLWISEQNKVIELQDNEDFTLYIASKHKDAKVLVYHCINNESPRSERFIDLNNSQTSVTFKYNELFTNDRHNEISFIKLVLVKNNELYSEYVRIKKAPKKYNFPLTLKTFRDKVTPGSKEKWSLEFKVTDKNNNIKEAEILALMYDASLDIFRSHWLRDISYYSFECSSTDWNFSSNYSRGEYYESSLKYDNIIDKLCSPEWLWHNAIHANWVVGFGVDRTGSVSRAIYGSRVRGISSIETKAAADIEVMEEEADDDNLLYECVSSNAAPKKSDCTGAVVTINEAAPSKSAHTFKIRENFNETAFFYPALVTNKKGEATFEFDVPESLTQWKFMAFAHTKDLEYGKTTKLIEATQPISIRAFLPRFMRRGDKQSLMATVARMDKKVKSAKVYIKLTDALNEKVLFESNKQIKLESNQTTVNFMYDIPESLSAAIVEFMVEIDGFTDGERYKVPVLNNCEHIVKSVNMIVKGGAEKSFKLPQVDKDASNKEVTVQYTANAAWNVVTALPSAKDYTNDAISLVNALYVNALSGNIAQTYPEIRKQVQLWSENSDNRFRKSPLENDEQLKSVLLEETPWVNAAERETKWKDELVNTLDTERATKECNKIIEKLKNFQNPDGGFTWFGCNNNYPSSYYTTLAVCETMSKMNHRGLINSIPGAKEMLAKALKFIDNETVKSYEYFKKYNLKYVSEYDLHNMMIRFNTSDVLELSGKIKSIYKEYITITNKNWVDLSLYGKVSLAIVDYKMGEKATAKKIIEAVREGYTKNDAEGIYWKSNQDFSRIYSSAILRQSLCIRAFALIDYRPEEIEMMKQWLIVRKSRTMWESNIATVDAIDAILFEAKNITSENISSTLTFGDVTLTATTETGNEGFVQYTSKENEIPSTISVKQAENAVGIGAVYISYDSKLENITDNASGLSIEKKTYLYTPDNDNTSMVLKELKSGDMLKVGDKVKVVLKIHNDQDLDFVALKDRRPACFEPKMVMSGYKYQNSEWFYQVLKDASMSYMFDRLQKGTHVFEYESSVTHEGEYQSGTATIQSSYNPSYNANSTTEAIKVKSK